jgi:HD superfamily phosphohydrolase
MEVRDPIHGAVSFSPDERRVLDHPFVQRLRNVKQVGFSEWAFPGASHSRYLHSIGVLHLAGRAFDSAYAGWTFHDPAKRRAFRQAVRLAALLHDLGHAPFSHCTEFAMPQLSTLGLQAYGGGLPDRRATHEDYTIGILTASSLTDELSRGFPCTPRHVACLISRDVDVEDDFFVDGDLDHRTVLSQIISSELDVDRLDYLVRDSFYSGAKYGHVDVNWILSNLKIHPDRGHVSLALDRRAIYAFDHFILARYHMFVMVYFHHKSVVYEEMLKRYFKNPACDYRIPSDMESYLDIDDAQLIVRLRAAKDPWAQAVVRRTPWRRVLELHGDSAQVDTDWATRLLEREGIETIRASSVGRLSRYTQHGQKRRQAAPIYVLEQSLSPGGRDATPLHEATAIFERYREARRIARLYVAPDDRARARDLLAQATRTPELF